MAAMGRAARALRLSLRNLLDGRISAQSTLQSFPAPAVSRVSGSSRLSEGRPTRRVATEVHGSVRAARDPEQPELTHCGLDVLEI